MWSQDSPRKGVWLERMLMFSKLTEKDFNINYTCQAYSDRGNPVGYFTLLPAGKNRVNLSNSWFLLLICSCYFWRLSDISSSQFTVKVLCSRALAFCTALFGFDILNCVSAVDFTMFLYGKISLQTHTVAATWEIKILMFHWEI